MDLTHFNEAGLSHIVDVGDKPVTKRAATAQAVISMKPETLEKILQGGILKGNVLAVAQVGGIMGAKQTSGIIPMCHNISLSGVDIEYETDKTNSRIRVICTAKCNGQTGVEMEALTGAAVCALTIYDMCKAIDRFMVIDNITLLEKKGGKSGHIKALPPDSHNPVPPA